MRANHETIKISFNGSDIELKPGQFITGRHSAVAELNPKGRKNGITPQRYRTAIKYLKSTSRITSKSTNQFSIISILKWLDYQAKSTSELTSKSTFHQPQTRRIRNDEEENKAAALLKNKFASFCLLDGKHYAPSRRDEGRLEDALRNHSVEDIEEMFEFYFKRKEPRKVYTINAALSSVSLSFYEDEKKKKSWNEV